MTTLPENEQSGEVTFSPKEMQIIRDLLSDFIMPGSERDLETSLRAGDCQLSNREIAEFMKKVAP